MKKNLMLCIDLKTFLQNDSLPRPGKMYHGDLVLTSEDLASFTESARAQGSNRNTRIFDGKYITLTYRMHDGHFRFNFKEVVHGPRFDIEEYAYGVKKEILQAFESFVGEV